MIPMQPRTTGYRSRTRLIDKPVNQANTSSIVARQAQKVNRVPVAAFTFQWIKCVLFAGEYRLKGHVDQPHPPFLIRLHYWAR
jgi:hypothetical protein